MYYSPLPSSCLWEKVKVTCEHFPLRSDTFRAVESAQRGPVGPRVRSFSPAPPVCALTGGLAQQSLHRAVQSCDGAEPKPQSVIRMFFPQSVQHWLLTEVDELEASSLCSADKTQHTEGLCVCFCERGRTCVHELAHPLVQTGTQTI